VKSYFNFLSRNWALLGFGFATVFWGNFGQSFFIGWFGADIQSSLGLSASLYGSAYSGATLVAAFGVVWLGGLVDRIPLRTYALAVTLGLAAAALVLSRTQSAWELIAGFMLLRLFGQALLPHTGMSSMARYFDADRGKAISVAMSAVPLGEIVLPILAVALIGQLGWQTTFFIIAIITVVVFLPTLLFLLRKAAIPLDTSNSAIILSASSHGGTSVRSGRAAMLSDYRYWLALPALLVSPFMMTGIFLHQSFIVESKSWTLSWLAGCFVVYGAMHWISAMVGGMLVDRFKAVRLLLFIPLPMLAALLMLAFVPGMGVALVIMVLLGIGAGSSPPVTGALWAEIYGTAAIGSIRSLNVSVMVVATAISPVLFGVLIDAGVSVGELFGFCALYVILAWVLLWFSYPAHGHAQRRRQ
jgi:predicted MFS family arabinose efflux permease